MKKILYTLILLLMLVGCNDNQSYLRYPGAYGFALVEDGSTFSGSFRSYAHTHIYEGDEIKLYIEAYTIDTLAQLEQTPESKIYYKYLLVWNNNVDLAFSCNDQQINFSSFSSNSGSITRDIRFINQPMLDKYCSSGDEIDILISHNGVDIHIGSFTYYENYESSTSLNWNEVVEVYDISTENYLIQSVFIIMLLVWIYKKIYYFNLKRFTDNKKKVLRLIDIKSFTISMIVLWLLGSLIVSIVNNDDAISIDTEINYNRYIDRVFKETDEFVLDILLNEVNENIYGYFLAKRNDYVLDIYFDDKVRPVDHREIEHKLNKEDNEYNIFYEDISKFEYIYIVVQRENVLEYYEKIKLDKYK